jgi:hypothetical protein
MLHCHCHCWWHLLVSLLFGCYALALQPLFAAAPLLPLLLAMLLYLLLQPT